MRQRQRQPMMPHEPSCDATMLRANGWGSGYLTLVSVLEGVRSVATYTSGVDLAAGGCREVSDREKCARTRHRMAQRLSLSLIDEVPPHPMLVTASHMVTAPRQYS